MKAASDLPIGATVVFSSVAAVSATRADDYAAANDLLCKISSSLRRTRPQTRALALDWTAWGGIGMATRGSIPKIMEMAGVQMLPPEAGVAWIRRELLSAISAARSSSRRSRTDGRGGARLRRRRPAALLGDVARGRCSAKRGSACTTASSCTRRSIRSSSRSWTITASMAFRCSRR